MKTLTSVDSFFRIADNKNLNSLKDFESLEIVNGDIDISDNSGSCDGCLQRLTLVGNIDINKEEDFEQLRHYGRLTGNIIIENTSLNSLKGLHCLNTVSGKLNIGGNLSLFNLNGLANLTTVEGDLNIEGNALQMFEAFGNITSIGGSLRIVKNDSLLNLAGFDKIKTIGKDLIIRENKKLEGISSFNSLQSVSSAIFIDDNPNLLNVDGFHNLTDVRDLVIDGNNTLNSLEFYNLERVSGNFEVKYNISLCTGDVDELINQITAARGISNIVRNIYNNPCY